MSDWLGLRDQRVLVAGGAGTLGHAIVAGFLDAGATVGVLDLDRDSIDRLDDELGGCLAAKVAADLRDGDNDWQEILATNLSSAFWLTQSVTPSMRHQGEGRLIFLSSVAGRSGHKNHAPYAASKGGINQLMRVAAHEFAANGVTVNAVAPGYMRTALTESYLTEDADRERALVDLIPARRFGRLEEIVGPVLFLASRQASFVHGQALYVDGGRSVI